MGQFGIVSKSSDYRSFIPSMPAGLQALLPLIWSWMLLSLNPLYLIFFVPLYIGMGGPALSSLARDLTPESSTRWHRFFGLFLIAAPLAAAVVAAVMKFNPLGILIAESALAFSLGVHFIASAYNYLKTPKEERTPLMQSNLINSGVKNLFQLGFLAASLCLFLIPGVNLIIGVAVLVGAFLYGAGVASWDQERRHKLVSDEFNANYESQANQYKKNSNTIINIDHEDLEYTMKSVPSNTKASSNPNSFHSPVSDQSSAPRANNFDPQNKSMALK